MGNLTAEQWNYQFLMEAARAGVHQPLLAALHALQRSPALADGETGLGIAPVNRVLMVQLETLPQQAHIAANTLRSITNHITAQGWKSSDIWDVDRGCYTHKFLSRVAEGYVPQPKDQGAGQLESLDPAALCKTYSQLVEALHQEEDLPKDLAYVDPALLVFVAQVPNRYKGTLAQQQALVGCMRLWLMADTEEEAIAALQKSANASTTAPARLPDFANPEVEQLLLAQVGTMADHYGGYPYQREALLHLVQGWRQLPSREAAIASLETDTSAQTPLSVLDAALMQRIQHIANSYQSRGDQRNWLSEAYRLWYDLPSRAATIQHLGIDAAALTDANSDALVDVARQLDRSLLQFLQQVPLRYTETDDQREALMRLVELWHRWGDRPQTLQHLLNQLRCMERASANSPDAPAPPQPQPPSLPPQAWTPDNLHLFAPILPGCPYSWADATQGGLWMPHNQAVVDRIIHTARQLQSVGDRLQRPCRIVAWHCSEFVTAAMGDRASHYHPLGDAVKLYCHGLSAQQAYWALDPWWPGSIGRYATHPMLLHLDTRPHRARWVQ